MKNSQINRLINKLNKDGYVTRNECLRQIPAITRLGALICRLERLGWSFDAGYTEDKKDYIYKIKFSPLKKSVYKIEGRGELITYS